MSAKSDFSLSPMNRRRRARKRDGAAFLMLVAMVAIVVLAAMAQLIRGDVARRNHHRQWQRTQTMLAAIKAYGELGDDWTETVTLPIGNESSGEHLELTRLRQGTPSEAIEVRWIRQGKQIDQSVRKVK